MKFSGTVGFVFEEKEVTPGVWRSNIIEKRYRGDILRAYRKSQGVSNQQNDDLTINNQISIISDIYSRNHWVYIKYVVLNGVKWKVNSIELSYPRLILDLGGVYNENGKVMSP